MTGKIIKGIAGFYYVHDGKSRLYECKAKGVFRNKKIKPLVGDDVEFSVLDEEELTGNIDRILPRKNALVRPAAANVDQAMVVFSITHPAPNLNLLDRFLVMMERQQVPVVICFNKVDLCEGDLMEQYENPIEHACDLYEGQVFTTDGWRKPDGLCDSAWQTLSPFVMTLAHGGTNIYDGWMKNPASAMISCNDGFRPVSFLIETLEK